MCSHSECRSPVINTVCRRRRAPPGPRQRPTLSERHKLKECFKLTTHCGRASGAEPAPLAGADQTAGDNDFCRFQDRDILESSPVRGLPSPPIVSKPSLLLSRALLKRLWPSVGVVVSRPDVLCFVLRLQQEHCATVMRRPSPMTPGKRRNSPLFDPVLGGTAVS